MILLSDKAVEIIGVLKLHFCILLEVLRHISLIIGLPLFSLSNRLLVNNTNIIILDYY